MHKKNLGRGATNRWVLLIARVLLYAPPPPPQLPPKNPCLFHVEGTYTAETPCVQHSYTHGIFHVTHLPANQLGDGKFTFRRAFLPSCLVVGTHYTTQHSRLYDRSQGVHSLVMPCDPATPTFAFITILVIGQLPPKDVDAIAIQGRTKERPRQQKWWTGAPHTKIQVQDL